MSVAFRRDGDDEHKEPRFELPIPPGPNLVTARGLALIAARVEALEAASSPEEATEAERLRDLRYWRTRLATAQLMPAPEPEMVAFGARVRFRRNGMEKAIEIVGDDEADPAAGRIAFSAPLARAMIGCAPGETADFAGRADAIEIVAVEPI